MWGGRYIKIDVKSTQGAHNWPICATDHEFGRDKDKFFILLDFKDIENLEQAPETYVIPSSHLDGWVREWQGTRLALYKLDAPWRRELYRNRWDLLDDMSVVWGGDFSEPSTILEYLSFGEEGRSHDVTVSVQFEGGSWTKESWPSVPSIRISNAASSFIEKQYGSLARHYMSFDGHPYAIASVMQSGDAALITARPPCRAFVDMVKTDWVDVSINDLMAASDPKIAT